MIKYEYKILGIEIRSAEAELNKFGAQGWEVIGFNEINSTMVRVVLMRPEPTGTLALLG